MRLAALHEELKQLPQGKDGEDDCIVINLAVLCRNLSICSFLLATGKGRDVLWREKEN